MNGKIVIREFGGPEVLEWVEDEFPAPGAREALIRQTAIGLNFIDVYHRQGLYPVALPFTPGVEAVGVIEATGDEVENVAPGDRVAYFDATSPGSYAEARILSADRLVKLPDSIVDVTAAGVMLKGATVEYLIRRTYPVGAGDWVLFHAASGGVGSIAMQWLRAIGANIIGTVGSQEKAAIAEQNGCQHTILYRDEDVARRVREITAGRGVDVVYDSVGKDTFEASLDSLKSRGMLVSFGNASGPVPDFAPLVLTQKGSLYLTRPRVREYYATPEDFAEGTEALLDAISSGIVRVSVNQTYPLSQVQQAHRDLEGRKTTGSTVLIPTSQAAGS
jgi:NADPH2:quinone reductase